MNTVDDFALETDPFRLRVAGAIRRMTVRLASKALWQLVGFAMDGTDEVTSAEVFSGIGYFARPPAGKKLEAIVLMVGADARTPVIVATRDEATRAKVAGAIAADETATFNTKSIILHKADGTIEARAADGIAKALPTLAAVQQLYTALGGAIATLLTTPGGVAGAAAALPLQAFQTALRDATQGGDPLWPSSTTVLKGE